MNRRDDLKWVGLRGHPLDPDAGSGGFAWFGAGPHSFVHSSNCF